MTLGSTLQIGIHPQPDDTLYTIHGIGGTEVAFGRVVDTLQVGKVALSNFEIEVGGMDYGFAINGILGMDFLTKAKATLDFNQIQMIFP